MASLHRRIRSKYWHAAWRSADGKLHMRTTKETSRPKAWVIALGWEHAERTAKTAGNVRKVMSEILERNTGKPLRTPTVREWFVEWLRGKREDTEARYSGVRNAFLAHLGKRADQPLLEIVPGDIQNYIDRVKKSKASDKTVALHLQALKSAFNAARRLQLIESNPADPISVTVDDEIQRELFTELEAKLILDAAEGEWKTLLLVGYYTGLRLTRSATLQWEFLDLAEKAISVRKPGKHGRAVLIPMHEKLYAHLMTIATSDRRDVYVMPTLAGAESGGKRGLSRNFKSIVRKAGVDMREVTRPNGHKFCKRSFHSLRHGFVSGLANHGVAPEQRRAMTGHKTDGVHARYTHLETETLREAINKLPPIPD
jgi:integrase